MRKQNPRRYNVAGLGDWGIVDGLVYENWKEEAFTLEQIRQQYKIESAFGLDFGYTNDPLTEYSKLLINIRTGLPASVARSTVIHELTHAFLFSYANEVEGEEQMCDFFGVHGDEIITLADQIMEGVVKC